MPSQVVDYSVELTQGELLLPQYDFDSRWSLTHVNERALVIPLWYVRSEYQRLEFGFRCYDTINEVYWTDNDPKYKDLIFGIFYRDSRIRLAVRTRSGLEYQNIMFYYGTASYGTDGARINQPGTAPGAWSTVSPGQNWTEILDFIIGAQGIGDFSQKASTIVHNMLAYQPGYSIYELEAIPGGSLIDGRFTDILELIDPISVNGVLIEEEPEFGPVSGPAGGFGGSFDTSSDGVDFASLPSGGAAASGLITMFAPTAAQLADFGQFLWTTLFDGNFDSLLTSLKKWVNDPIESVIQLAAYPVTPPSGSATVLKFCGIRSDLIGTGVSMNRCTSQFMDFDFGQLSTPAFWKQALDYSPYTQVSIYLPYIGICPLKSDDVIDATLHLKYHIDLLTGGFSAELKCTKNIDGTPLNSVLYNWSGNMATQIPITSSNFSQVFGSMMTAVAAIGVGAITGGMGAAAAGGGAEAAGSAAIAGGALSGAGHGLAANIGNVINSKPHVTQSGRLDGTVGALSQFTPYLIIERPVQSLSAKFQEEQGYPSNIVQRLGDLSGLTVCEAPIMTGFSGATEEEKEAIRALLCGGVIL